MTAPVLVGAVTVAAALSAQTALAQQDKPVVRPYAVELVGADKKVVLAQAVPIGPSTLLLASAMRPEDDADKRLVILGDGAPAEPVELVTPVDVKVGDAPLWLVTVKMPDGVSLKPVSSIDVSVPLTTNVAGWRVADGKNEAWSEAVLSAADAGALKVSGLTESTPLPSMASNPFVYDLCGSVIGLATPASDTGGAIISAATLQDRFAQFNGGNGFAAAAPCALNQNEINSGQRAASAQHQLEVERQAVSQTISGLKSQLAAEKNAAKVAAIQKQIEAQETLLKGFEARDSEVKTLVDDLRKQTEAFQQNAAESASRAGENRAAADTNLYIAVGIGVLAILALGIAGFLFFRSRGLDSKLEAARKEKAKAEKAKEAAAARWNDCLLESESGTLKLSGDKLPKSKGGVVVGRSREDADVLLDQEDVSRRHARFEEEAGVVEVIDLGAMNGTRVNDVVLEKGVPRRLYEGDAITLGRARFIFRVLRSDE